MYSYNSVFTTYYDLVLYNDGSIKQTSRFGSATSGSGSDTYYTLMSEYNQDLENNSIYTSYLKDKRQVYSAANNRELILEFHNNNTFSTLEEVNGATNSESERAYSINDDETISILGIYSGATIDTVNNELTYNGNTYSVEQ